MLLLLNIVSASQENKDSLNFYTLRHLIRQPTPTENPALLLMLHSYGSNEQDLFSFASELPDELLIVSAQAPMSMGFGQYAWYTISFGADDSKFSDIPEAIHARDLIIQFIDELQETYHFDPKRSFLMGFSQGTILSYAVTLTAPDKIKNILALSGYINDEMIVLSKDKEELKELSFFCSHGSVDPVIPVEWARKLPKQLDNYAVQYVYKEYYAGHGIVPNNINDFKNWINDILLR